jgi:hypothetical protein
MSLSKSHALSALVLLGLIIGAALALVLSGSKAAEAQSSSLPAAKASVAIDELINLSQTAGGPPNSAGSTGWVDVLETRIKTSQQKDLVFDVAMQCGIVTDTTVKSSGGTTSAASARGTVSVRVLVDGVPAEPDNSIDANKATAPGVVYCDRIQTLAAKFAGLNCTADPVTGVVTCADPEELRLILRTLNANAFNFARDDVGVGVHQITVQAQAAAAVNFDDDASGGAMAGAEAFLGAGSLLVEEVRLVKGEDITIDIQ